MPLRGRGLGSADQVAHPVSTREGRRVRHMAATTWPFSRIRITTTDVTRSVTSAGIRLISRETDVWGAVIFFSIGTRCGIRKLFLLGGHLDDTIHTGFAVERLRGLALHDFDRFDCVGLQ